MRAGRVRCAAGGAVAGGQFVGDWPSYLIDGTDDAGDKGRMIPSMSVNRHGAPLARWHGPSIGNVNEVVPDLSRDFDDGGHSTYGLFDAA